MIAVAESPLALQAREAQIAESDAALLLNTFGPFFAEAELWRQKAATISVTSVEDKTQMSEARRARLALKEIRVNVEKSRKSLKEESLRKGKAIDGMANVVKFLIVPIEEELEAKENYAETLKEKERQATMAKREVELLALGADPSFYDLAAMPESDYLKLLEGAREAFALKKEAQERAERERAEKERAAEEERVRMRAENERLKAQAEAERAEREKAEAELRAKRDQERKDEEERLRVEREKAAKEKAARLAPDREKLTRLADSIVATPMPEVSSPEAKAIVKRAIELLAQASKYVKTQAVSL